MPLAIWAERLVKIDPQRVPVASLGLHLADTVAALYAGLATREGKALLQLHGSVPTRLARPSDLAAMAGVIRLTEMDDIHLETGITPSAAIVPAALATALTKNTTPEGLTRGLVAGYATQLRYGRALGGATLFKKGIWPSLITAPLGAAATAASMMDLSVDRTATALRLALMRSSGRAGRPPDDLPARWYVFGEAVADGFKAALAAAAGFAVDPALDRLLPEGADRLFAEAIDPSEIEEISQKPFCTARQAAGGVVLVRELMRTHALNAGQIARIEVEVPSANVDLLTQPLVVSSRLSTIANQAFQIAAAVLSPELLVDAGRAGPFPSQLIDFCARVHTRAAADLDEAYPRRWPTRVRLTTTQGTSLTETRREIEGDPGMPLGLDRIRQRVPAAPERLLADAMASTRDGAALDRLVGLFAR